MRKSVFAAVLVTMCCATQAQPQMFHEFDELMTAFGTDLSAVEISTEEIGPGVHVLFGNGGNILASVGEQGTLIVDSMFAALVPKIRDAVNDLGGDGIDFVVNTHFHFDHADGNPLLARSGSWIVTHANARRMMAGVHPVDMVALAYMQPAYPTDTLPVITYDDRMQMHFNGEAIELLHFSPAHTTGDTAVYFRTTNIVHMGDVFNAGYPFIDAGNGGDLEGMIEFCRGVLHAIEEDTAVLPGHGPVMAYEDLEQYVAMLETIRDRISALIDAGSSLEQVIAAEPTSEFDQQYGMPGMLINRAYMSLSR